MFLKENKNPTRRPITSVYLCQLLLLIFLPAFFFFLLAFAQGSHHTIFFFSFWGRVATYYTVLTSPTYLERKHAQSLEFCGDPSAECWVTCVFVCLDFAQRMKAKLTNGGVPCKSLVISDEAHFHLCERLTDITVVIMLVQIPSA